MARAAKSTAKDIESLKHCEARRKHIPKTELESLVSEDERAPKVIRYKRNTDLDPQLVWRGKDEQNADDLMVDAVPIYIQEKIKPEQIISDLRPARKQSAASVPKTSNTQSRTSTATSMGWLSPVQSSISTSTTKTGRTA